MVERTTLKMIGNNGRGIKGDVFAKSIWPRLRKECAAFNWSREDRSKIVADDNELTNEVMRSLLAEVLFSPSGKHCPRRYVRIEVLRRPTDVLSRHLARESAD